MTLGVIMPTGRIFSTLLFALGIVALALAGSARAGDLAAAKQNYDSSCVLCHGAGGRGDGSAGAATKPSDFTDCAAMSKISDDTMFNVIKNGGAAAGLSNAMQAWGSGFSDAEIHDLVSYVRTFCKK
jgi:mono/diheme cytochrome c family protein